MDFWTDNERAYSTLERVKIAALRVEPVGSRVTCNPPPTGTDADFLVLVRNDDALADARLFLLRKGFDQGGSVIPDQPEGQGRETYRLGEVNIILTSDQTFFDRFMAATVLAKRFNLLEKRDRVDLFQAMRGDYQHLILQPDDDLGLPF